MPLPTGSARGLVVDEVAGAARARRRARRRPDRGDRRAAAPKTCSTSPWPPPTGASSSALQRDGRRAHAARRAAARRGPRHRVARRPWRAGAALRQRLPVLLRGPAPARPAAVAFGARRRLPPLVPAGHVHDAHQRRRARPRAHRGLAAVAALRLAACLGRRRARAPHGAVVARRARAPCVARRPRRRAARAGRAVPRHQRRRRAARDGH